MPNVTFGGLDLQSYGFALLAINGRELVSWKAERAKVLGRYSAAELSGAFEIDSKTAIAGMLSAPTDPKSSETHANFLANFRSLKDAIDPELGYQKLVIADDLTLFRWCRFVDMAYTEDKPGPGYGVLKRPANPVAINFDNLEPFWRRTHTQVAGTGIPLAIANAGRKTRPKLTLTITGTINTASQSLLTFADGFQVIWDGSLVSLANTDKVVIDSENLTVTKQTGGVGALNDAIRAYGYNKYSDDGFPVIPKAGGSITAKHASVGNIAVDYDELFT